MSVATANDRALRAGRGSAPAPLREIDVRAAAVGGAFASAIVGLVALATSGPVGPLPPLVLGIAVIAGALRLRRSGLGAVQARGTFRTGLATFLLAFVVVPLHSLIADSWILGAVDLLVILQANRLLAMREGAATGQVLVLALLMLLGAAILTIRLEFLYAVFFFCLSGTWTAIFRMLDAPDARGSDTRVPRSLGWIALAAGLALFALTGLFFAILPRLQVTSFGGGLLESASEGVSGFSDEVRLGEIGATMMDPRPVLRATLSGRPVSEEDLYWRGIALDRYESGRWSVSVQEEESIPPRHDRVEKIAGFRVLPAPGGSPIQQEIFLEALDVSVLFGLPAIHHVRADLPFLSTNATDSIIFRARRYGRLHYWASSWPVEAPRSASARAVVPRKRGATDDEAAAEVARYLQIPDDVRIAIEPLAREIAGRGSDLERVAAIESAMRAWTYALTSPKGTHPDPVVTFVTESKTGWCEQYSSGMILMLRSIGIPARMANGFSGGEKNEFGNYWLVRRSDAHSWVEVPFENAGWVTFDPTPGGRIRTPSALGGARRAFDWLRLAWTQRVVGYDILDQFAILQAAASGAEGFSDRLSAALADPGAIARRVAAPGLAVLVLAALALAARRIRRARVARASADPASAEAERWWSRVERRFRREGFVRKRGETARELAQRAGRPSWADVYYVARFGGRALSADERSAVERIRKEI